MGMCGPICVLGQASLTPGASVLSGAFSLDWLQAPSCGFHQTHGDGFLSDGTDSAHTTSSTPADTANN